jgi:hypothetical protein
MDLDWSDMPTDQRPLSRTQLCPLKIVIKSLVDRVERRRFAIVLPAEEGIGLDRWEQSFA